MKYIFTQALKDKWLKALRSGRYKQGKDRLENDGAYCCLGVLCKVVRVEVDDYYYVVINNQFAFLPHRTQMALSRRNDSGRSFSDIADYIEAKIPARTK